MSFGVGREGLDGFRDPLGAVLRAFEPVRDLDPADMVDEELKSDLLRLARHRSREDATFATWTLAAVRRGVGVSDGYADTIGWLAWQTRTPRAELRKVVRMAAWRQLLRATGHASPDGPTP